MKNETDTEMCNLVLIKIHSSQEIPSGLNIVLFNWNYWKINGHRLDPENDLLNTDPTWPWRRLKPNFMVLVILEIIYYLKHLTYPKSD